MNIIKENHGFTIAEVLVSLAILVFAMIPIINVYNNNYEHEKVLQQRNMAMTLAMKHLDDEKRRFLTHSQAAWNNPGGMFVSAETWTTNPPSDCGKIYEDTPVVDVSKDRSKRAYNPAIKYTTDLTYNKNSVPYFDVTSGYKIKDGMPVTGAGTDFSENRNLLLKLTAQTTWQDQHGKDQIVEVSTYVTNR